MDLPGFPGVFEALRERLRHPVVGYTRPASASRDLVVSWYREIFGAAVDPEWVVQLPFGPRPAIRFVLDAVVRRRAAGSAAAAPVLVAAPEYDGIAQVAGAAGLRCARIPLHRTARGYRLPVGEFEARARSSGVSAIALSSPHNPTGRVWTAEEIRRLASAAASQGGVLISDEVHSGLVYPGYAHPVAVHAAGPDLAAWTVTVHSVGKMFNISGLADVLLLVPSPDLRKRIVETVEEHGFFEGARPLGALAQDAAFVHGGPWRDSLVAFLAGNRDLAVSSLEEAAPGLVTGVPEASYLLWLDGAALAGGVLGAGGRDSGDGTGLRAALLRAHGVDLQDGASFGPAGRGFLRLNFALPRPRLREAVERLASCAAGR